MKTILATAAAIGLAITATPVMADNHSSGDDIMLNAQQKTMMETWPANRQETYMGWPKEAQAYYWTLSEDQKQGWWMLDDPQRLQILGMTPADQAMAWRSIATQIGTAPAAPATSARTTSTNSDVRFVSNAVVQNAPAPHNGEYPVCNDGRTDNCVNP